MNKKMKYEQVQRGRMDGNGGRNDSDGDIKKKRVRMKILKDLNEGGEGKGEEEEGRELPRDFFDVEEEKEDNKGGNDNGGGNNKHNNKTNNIDNANNNNNHNDNTNNDDCDSSEDSNSVSHKLNDEYEDEANIMIEYSTRIANIISTYKDKQQHKHKHNQPLHTSSNTNTNKQPNTFLSVKRVHPSPSPLSKAALLSEILN